MRTLPAWVDVDLDALGANLRLIQERIGASRRILLIVKADAYGHGSVEVAREAIHSGVHMLGVATVDEALQLRDAGIDSAILVLSPALPDEIDALVSRSLRTTVPDLEFAARLSRASQDAGVIVPVHIEIDTGMGRSGFHADVAVDWVRRVVALPGIQLEGLYTHFPVSDTDVAFTQAQVQRFRNVIDELAHQGVRATWTHASNSAGILNVEEAHLDLVRPGGMAYGCLPHPSLRDRAPLRRVMSFRARLVQVRHLPPRSSISYGGDVVTCAPLTMGVVPVGYGHGLQRSYSGRGTMLFRGQRVHVLGRITMDMTMVDLTDFEEPRVGEEVVLFGRQGDDEITVDEIAEATGVLGYEILCGISKRVVRVYRRNGGVESMRGLTGVRQASSRT
jgi:alanine racemase